MRNIFRVFVSSTFGDFKAEREVLQRIVFPKLTACCQQHGAAFMGVDLRWGISPERARHNQTMHTCFEEIQRCQDISPRPNFLILLGERYGWLPLAESIEDEIFVQLREKLAEKNQSAADLLGQWYRKDENAVPPLWILQPRHETCPDDDLWFKNVAQPLQQALSEAASQLDLDPSKALPFTASATHQEIEKGYLACADCAPHVFAWRRRIRDLNDQDEKQQSLYRDDHEQALEAVAGQLREKLGDHYLEWEIPFAQLLMEEVSETQLTPYLRDFAQNVFNMLWSQIQDQIEGEPSFSEEGVHRAFAAARAEGFVGRVQELDDIRAYLAQPATRPYILIGPGGIGKTSLLAKCVADQADDNWQVRFAGASSHIGDATSLLVSLWPTALIEEKCNAASQSGESAKQFIKILGYKSSSLPKSVSEAVDARESGQDDGGQMLAGELTRIATIRQQELLADITAGFKKRREASLHHYLTICRELCGGSLVVIIDALDQLEGAPDLAYLLRQLGKIKGTDTGLPENVWVVASLRDERSHDLTGLSRDEWEKVIDSRFARFARSLTSGQRGWLAAGWERSKGNPLTLKLAIETALRLHSWDAVPEIQFSVSGFVDYLYRQLDDPHQHGVFGGRALAYLAFARNGLPETVLLNALVKDEQVGKWFNAQIKHTQQQWLHEDGLPPIFWSRLYTDLKPYLVPRDTFGTPALRFFHRQFQETASAYAKEHVDARSLAYILAAAAWRRLFGVDAGQLQDTCLPTAFQDALPDGWALGELPWLLEQAGFPDTSRQLLASPDFIMAKVGMPGGVVSLADDYARQASSPWTLLLRRHFVDLLVHREPRKLLIQLTCELPVDSLVRQSTEQWLKVSKNVEYWIRDLLPKPESRYELSLSDGGINLMHLPNGHVAAWPIDESDENSQVVRILDPDQPTSPVLFLENRWGRLIENPQGWVPKFLRGHVKEIVVLPDSGYLVSRHTHGPIMVWLGERCIATLHLVMPRKPHNFSRSETVDREALDPIGATDLFPLDGGKLLVVYADGAVGRWTLPELAVKDDAPPAIFRTDDPEHYEVIAEVNWQDIPPPPVEPTQYKWSMRHASESQGLITLVFAVCGAPYFPLRVVIVSSRGSKQLYSTRKIGSVVPGYRFLPTTEGCFFTDLNLNTVFLLTAQGEHKIVQVEKRECVIALFGDASGGIVIVVGKEYNDDVPWRLMRLKPDMSIDWQRDSCLVHEIPLHLKQLHMLIYQTNSGVKILSLDTFDEIEFEVDQMPQNAVAIDTHRLLAWNESMLYAFDLRTRETWIRETCQKVISAIARNDDILTTHDDGMLRSWSWHWPEPATSASHKCKVDQVFALDDTHILTCERNRYLLWHLHGGEAVPKVVWQTEAKEEEDVVNVVTPTQHGEVITWGDHYINIWLPGQDVWHLKSRINWPKYFNIPTAVPVLAVLAIDAERFLFEYGPGVEGRGARIGLLSRMNGSWSAETLPLPYDMDGQAIFYTLLSPVMPDGDVLFRADPGGDYIEEIRYAIYSLNGGKEPIFYAAGDEELNEWLRKHADDFDAIRTRVVAEIDTLSEGIVHGENGHKLSGGAIDSWFDSPRVKDFDNEDMRNKEVFFRVFPASLELALREDARYSSPQLRRIGIANKNGAAIATYHDHTSYRLWVNRLRETGQLFLTDAYRNLRILQLMRGADSCALPLSADKESA